MVRKITVIGIALIGITLATGGNAWAERNRGDKGQRNDKVYHNKAKTPPGHHYGWEKGTGNPHRDRHYKGRQQRKRSVKKVVSRPVPKYHHRVVKHVYRPVPKHHRRVVKQVHHYVPERRPSLDDFNLARALFDPIYGTRVLLNSIH
jgi:hypothetical protein